MGEPHPLALRERVVAFVEDGNTHRSAATHFRVSIKFVNDMVIMKRKTGSPEPKAQGELALELLEQHGVKVARSPVGYWLHRPGLSHKKNAAAK